MHIPSRGHRTASTILCILGISISAHAEEAYELEDLVVTAGLEPIAAEDVAGSLTVITREEIEQKQVMYLSELLRTVPGFAVSQSGGPGTLTQVRVRGSEANHVLVLIDGIRANDPASGDAFQFEHALASDIERVEIIRGPQSATWGTDALAGVINIIRRKDIAPERGYLKSHADGGSFGTITVGAEGGIRRGISTFSGGVSYLESDGTNISRAGTEEDGTENLTADARLQIQATDRLRLAFVGQHVDANNDFDEISFVSGLPEDSDHYTRADRSYLSAIAAFNSPLERWDARAEVNRLDSDNQNYAFGSWSDSTAARTTEFRLQGSFGLDADDPINHRLTLALDHREVKFSQRGIASDFGDPNQDQSYDVGGYAAEYVGRPFEGFTWTLSGRHDAFSAFEDATTWQAAASRRWDSGFRLRASVGTGFKVPTFLERFGFFPDFFQGNPGLEPETSLGWEVGIDVPLGNGGFVLSATWFDQELEDEIDGFVFDPASGAFTAVNRPGSSERQGVELVLDGAIGEKLSLAASYTYTDASEFGTDGQVGPEVRRPEHMASLTLNRVFADGRGNVNLNVSYNGTQLDNFFPPPNYSAVQVELEGFTLVDLAASWNLTSKLEVTGRITNLLDEDYEEIYGFARPGIGYFVGLRGHLTR